MADNDAPGCVWSVWTPGARFAGFIKRTFILCNIQNMKAIGLVVSEKIFFLKTKCSTFQMTFILILHVSSISLYKNFVFDPVR